MKSISLTKGRAALVDDEDYGRLSAYKWHCTSHGYAATRLRDEAQTHVYMHRMVMNAPSGQEVDHINGIGLDNRKANLRLCSSSQNKANKRQQSNNRSSNFKGVCFDRSRGKWLAQLTNQGKKYHRRFNNEREAALYYDAAARAEFGEFAQLNFPEPEGNA